LVEEYYDRHPWGSQCIHCGADRDEPHYLDCSIVIADKFLKAVAEMKPLAFPPDEEE